MVGRRALVEDGLDRLDLRTILVGIEGRLDDVGRIGRAAFRRLIREPRLDGKPMILETPLGDDGQGHRRDHALLRKLAGRNSLRSGAEGS